jgi:hypothetical protein
MLVNVFKAPFSENDTFLIKLIKFNLAEEKLNILCSSDEYLDLKIKRFREKNTSTSGFEKFEKKASLSRPLDSLEGSIYTYTCEIRNNDTYSESIDHIKTLVSKNSRRAILRFLNSGWSYYSSETINKKLNVTCLAYIQYFKDRVSIVFRASDLQEELFVDIITIYEFFIKPIYNIPINIEIYSTSVQNHLYFGDLINKLELLEG